MVIRRVRFFVSDQVQDVGCRGFVISEMMFAGFAKGNAINLSDGRVEVRLEGEENKIKEFVEELRKKLELKYGSNSAPKVEVSETESFEGTELRELTEVSQAHLLTQFDKGVDVMKDIRTGLDNLNEKFGKFDNKLDSVGSNLGSMGTKLDSIGSKLGSMDSKLNSMDSKLDVLPKRIAEELDSKFTSLPKQIAFELDSIFDRLFKRMAVELKAVLRG